MARLKEESMARLKQAESSIPVIVCTGTNGRCVVYGHCDHEPVVGEAVVLTDARMILYWAGTRGLFGLSQHGPEPQSRLTCRVARTTCAVQQALSVSEEAARAIELWPDA